MSRKLKLYKTKFGDKMKYETEQRKTLKSFFSTHPHEAFTAKQIYKILDNSAISLSAVYRNLADLEAGGLLRRTYKSDTRESYYRYISPKECAGHIHLTCKKCGKTVHMENDDTLSLTANVQKYKNFLLDKTETVLYGLCGTCRNS